MDKDKNQDGQLLDTHTCPKVHVYQTTTTTTTTTTLFAYIKYTNITLPVNSKANRGRWCVDGSRFFTIVEMNNKVPYCNKKGQSREKLR